MKKLTIPILLIFSILICALSLSNYFKLNNFNSGDVKETLTYLSADSFKGRLGGTVENAMTANYIKNEFKKLGLEPINGSYYQDFQVNCPTALDNTPMLSIIDSEEKIIKTYEYGVNYKESLLNFRINEMEFNKSNIYSQNTNGIFITNPTNNNSILLFSSLDSSLKFRSSFFENSQADLYINVTTETLADINSYLDDGYSIYTYIPYEVQEKTLNNVVGMINGSDSSLPPLVFGAHFDHVGTDLEGTVYNGALDNASGTAFLLELVQYIKSLGVPERDIIFVAFNAEELGLKGSTAFAEEYANILQDSKVYNFDMIGSYDGVPLCIMSGAYSTAKTPLVDEVATVMKDKKIYFNYLFQDASDHAPFTNMGIEAVTLCDNDTTRIHTPSDRIEYISEDAISRCFSVMKVFIINDAFSSNFIYNNITPLMIISALSTTVLIVIIIISKIKEHNYKTKGR